MTRTRGPGQQHDTKRAAILAAVQEIAAGRGIAAVSQATVAVEAGISPGRVQYYFPSKTALLHAAFTALNDASRDRIRELVGGDLDQAEPRFVLETVLTQLVPGDAETRAHLQFRQAYTSLALHHDEIAAELRAQYAGLHRRELADLIRREQQTGRIHLAADAESTAVRLAALAEGLAYYVLIDAVPADKARDLVLADVAALYPGGG